ncbi:unnamed protein product [Mytilus coruscus]|uniref:DNA helicase Pif1-like 2B domain-containing protein n=1 Tax=Mytilus coruscus TaxID=42192 RepID=A0A6J8D6Q9_MYTCO|nr:unnamed protein product [Mytilus coruscus]
MRVRSNGHSNNQADFENFLLRIGNGQEKLYSNIGSAKIQLPKDLCICLDKNGLKTLPHKLYGDILKTSEYSKFTDRAILTTTIDDVDTINTMVMDMFPSAHSKTYLSADTVEDEFTGHLYPTEFLNSITRSGTPPHKLTLKKHAPIMLLRNLNPAAGLRNGTTTLHMQETLSSFRESP